MVGSEIASNAATETSGQIDAIRLLMFIKDARGTTAEL